MTNSIPEGSILPTLCFLNLTGGLDTLSLFGKIVVVAVHLSGTQNTSSNDTPEISRIICPSASGKAALPVLVDCLVTGFRKSPHRSPQHVHQPVDPGGHRIKTIVRPLNSAPGWTPLGNTGIAWNRRSWKQSKRSISVDSDMGPFWRLNWAK